MGAHAEREQRRALGAWYTPEWLVARVLDTVLAGAPPPRSVLDPSCGDGRFLAAAAERWPDATLHGVDVDVAALAEARRRVGPRAVLHHGDGLVLPADGGFDLVVGNPPFLNQLSRRTSRGGRSPLGGGPYADAAALFLARAVAMARDDGGRVALVLPQSILAARDARSIRAAVGAAAAVEGLWLDVDGSAFDAAVHTLVLSCRRGAAQGPVRRWVGRGFARRPAAARPEATSWSPLVADLRGVPTVTLPAGDGVGTDTAPATVGARASATADFRDQYYGLVGRVGDDLDGPSLVTTGLVDPGVCAWGRRPVRFAGARYERPRVDVGALDVPTALWAARRLVPKVLLATQTTVLEACADTEGAWLPAVPLISVVPHDPLDVWPLTAVLCSPVASAWAAQLTMGSGLSATALRLRAGQVGDVPLPRRPWADGVDALRAGDLGSFGRAMAAAYDVDGGELLAWWLPRAERAAGVAASATAPGAAAVSREG